MTLVAERPAPAAPRPTPQRPADPARQLPPLGRDVVATVALAAYSLAIAAGFARVFSGWEFLPDLALVVLAGHGASLAMRRARLTGWIAAPLLAVFLLWLLTAQRYRSTLTGPLPTGDTWRLLDLDLALVREQFPTAIAPVIYDAGWAALAGLAMVLVVFLADLFAFRASARGEALVPGGVLFVFVAALGDERMRTRLTVLVVVAGVVAVVALRHVHDRTRRVARHDQGGAGLRLVPAVLATALVVGFVAGAVGPRLPGAGAEPLYDTKGRGNDVTEVISPLVDIRSRLTNRGNNELFRVNADRQAYWRQTTLAEFDGRRFGLPSRSLERVDGVFDPADGESIRQQLQILGLGGQLVPAAADPYQASGATLAGEPLDLRVNRDTSTLLTPDDLSVGDLFTIVSSRPAATPEVLRAAGSSNPPDEIFLGLPDDFPSDVRQAAADVTAGAATSYDAVLALQNWFREEFSYSVDVQAGHSIDAIETFLRIRVGYCEQFAVTFAAMGRALGIPTRVAVGFTPGVLGSDGWFSVRGRNAHAWPEVWFDGIGWVAFEPTPGRGAPGAEGYTGVAAVPDVAPGGNPEPPPDGTVAPRPTTPETAVPPAGSLPPGGRPANPAPGIGDPDAQPPRPSNANSGTGSGGRTELIAVVVFAALAAAAATPWVVRRARRRLAARDDVEQVIAAWRRAVSAAARAGVVSEPAMTPRRLARATAERLPVAARPMASLAEVVDLVTFSPPDRIALDAPGSFGRTLADDCTSWSHQVVEVADDLLSPTQRLKRYFTDFS